MWTVKYHDKNIEIINSIKIIDYIAWDRYCTKNGDTDILKDTKSQEYKQK